MLRNTLRLAALAAACLAAVVLAGCGGDDNAGETASAGEAKKFSGRTLTIASPGGALTEAERKAYYDPFERATGAKVRAVETEPGVVLSLLKSTVKAGNPPWDLVTSATEIAMHELGDQGLLQNIDAASVPGTEQLSERYTYDFGIATEVDAVVAAYSTKGGTKSMPTAKAFFDPTGYPGERAVAGPNTAVGGSVMCLLALEADGVPAEQLVPMDIDRCLRVWDRVKPAITSWWNTGSEMAHLLVDDQVKYCLCFDGRVQQARRTNPDWSYSLQDALSISSWTFAPKGGGNQDMIRELLRFMMDPRHQAVFVESLGYSVANPNVEKYLPSDLKPYLSTSKENQPKLLTLTPEQAVELAKQNNEILKRWARWTGQ